MSFTTSATSGDWKRAVRPAAANGSRLPTGPDIAEAHTARMLLVAGPSGAGKSTFIELLTKRQLPAEISAELPRGADRWPQFEANNCLKDRVHPETVQADKASGSGIVLHYDIVFTHRYGIHEYERDPAAALFARDGCPVIVFVKPRRDRLIRQFESRLKRHLSRKSPASRLWARYVRHPMRRAAAPLRRRPQPLVTASVLYDDHDWLGRCYQQWDAFMRTIVRDKPRSKVLYVEPCCDDVSSATFRLIGSTAV